MEKKKLIEQIIPTYIEISSTNEFYHFIHKIENKNGVLIPNQKKLFEFSCDDLMPGIEVTDEFYLRILSVRSLKDAEHIVQELCGDKYLIFSFWEEYFKFKESGFEWDRNLLYNFVREEYGIEREQELLFSLIYDDYGIKVAPKLMSVMVYKEIQKFKKVLTIFNAIQEAIKEPSNFSLVEKAFMVGEENGIGITFDPNDKEMLNDTVNIIYHEGIQQYVAISEFDIEDTMSDWEHQGKINVNRENIITYLKQEKKYCNIEQYAMQFTSYHINPIIKNIEIRQDSVNGYICFHCKSILSAMYQKMLLCIYAKEKYKKCSRCERYFKVDRHHPQSMCDIHMAARRRKRQNYRKNNF